MSIDQHPEFLRAQGEAASRAYQRLESARIAALRRERQAQYDQQVRTAQARLDALQADLLKPLVRRVEQMRVQPAMHTNGEMWWIEA